MSPPHRPELDAAVQLATRAGRALLEFRRTGPSGVETKSTGTDMVSDADRRAEQLIADGLAQSFPDDSVVGEEGALTSGGSGRRWVVDPLDGTTNFLYGLDAWCVSLGLEDDEGPLAGCVHHPARQETFVAWRGEGAWLGGARLRASSASDLSSALLGTGFSYRSDQRRWQAAVVGRLLPQVRDIRRNGAAALDLCWVGAGRLDAHVERGLAPWDHAAGALVAEEAGAVVRRPLDGEPWGLVVAAAPGIAGVLAAEVDLAEQAAGTRPE